jgi:hypothetical protein
MICACAKKRTTPLRWQKICGGNNTKALQDKA